MPETAQDLELILGRPSTEAPDISYTRVGYELVFENVDPTLFTAMRKTANKMFAMEDMG